ncbi:MULTISPECIES: hypothetical protein [Chryseobacterium]|uniref:hypothetical protein n=1 Tax=Chryseobacterium TaxID=59732 RepID=UPI0023589A01|nr:MULTISPECIES: hypothetical protein [unclassified Chryseobacterium]MDC8105407.1 hypothetical protein [Chryseobacterium sp. B21-037]MDQ1805662.1 hypothetical protein [Chryseobacterium sp. CKR4-1]
MKFKFLVLFLIISIKIFATGQQSNFITIDGKNHKLLNDPLEGYFVKHPEDHPVYGEKFVRKNENGDETFLMTTSNHRGYIAYFEIIDNELFLIDLTIADPDSDSETQISVFNKIFPDKKTKLNYSGILTVPNGDFIDSDNFGFSSYYSSYLILTLSNDILIKSKELQKEDYIKFKINQFKAFQKTEEYRIEYKNYLKRHKEDKEWDLSHENTKELSKEEIRQIRKQYAKEPSKDEIDGFLFMMSNLEKIYVDY